MAKHIKQPKDDTRYLSARRDEHKCVRCGRSLYNIPVSLHHRRMRSHPFPGLHEASNLIWLCGSGTTGCHGYVHEHQTEAYQLGYLVSAYAEPKTSPVKYPDGRYYLLDDDGNKTEYTVAE